MDIVQNLIFNQ